MMRLVVLRTVIIGHGLGTALVNLIKNCHWLVLVGD